MGTIDAKKEYLLSKAWNGVTVLGGLKPQCSYVPNKQFIFNKVEHFSVLLQIIEKKFCTRICQSLLELHCLGLVSYYIGDSRLAGSL